jgi:hypothetical protein
VLDGLRGELMRPSTPDQPAFHEGLADIVALLSGLSHKELIKLVLPRVSGRGPELVAMKQLKAEKLKKSVLLGLAEQFGRTLAQQKLIPVRGNALRRSVELNPKVSGYQKLLKSDAEPHDFGETLVAAVMNAFLAVWEARIHKGLDPTGSGLADRDRVAEEGAKAAQHLLRMAIRAIDYMPPVNISFRDFLSALLTADSEAVPDDEKHGYREHLTKTFRRYEIRPPEGTKGGLWRAPKNAEALNYGFSHHAEMTWDREAVMRFIWENSAPLEVETDAFMAVTSVRPAVRIGPDGFILRETVAEYFQLLDVTGRELKTLKLEKPRGMPDSARVRLYGGGTLIFDDYGRLKFHIGSGVLSSRQNERLKSLWAHGQTGVEPAGARRFEEMHRMRALGAPRWRTEW